MTSPQLHSENNPGSSAASGLAASQSEASIDFQPSNRARVLIVDDSADNLRVLSATLAGSNYEIRCAKNGKTALKAIAAAELPDLILLDIQMPDIDGYEVCKRLKKDARSQHIPVIFISALDDALDKVKAFSVGGVDYITKPFQVEEVLARVRNQLNLQSAKMQLAQAEKMASLGQMVAGIAHEINNPVGFIQGNLNHLGQYVGDLLTLIEAYQQQYPEPSSNIDAVTREIDLEYLKKDLPHLFKSMTVGTARIAEIVKSLRNFSRLDESDYKQANIHEGIEGTLLILDNRMKARGQYHPIKVVKKYGDFPDILCYPGALNQVFLNLIANAIDAIDSKRSTLSSEAAQSYQPQITIQTEQTNQITTIHIRDNGCGMKESTKARAFNPFFTTKLIGEGTGLGLSTSYQIVHDKHNGQLSCQSQPDAGAEFAVELPTPQ